MIKAHKIKLSPTKPQEVLFKKSCGVARFAYNWALNKWREDYKNGIKHSAYSLVKHLKTIKRKEFPWMQETGKTCPQYAIHNLETAFKRMFKESSGYPKFKKKGSIDSFVAVENTVSFRQEDYKIRLPRIGWVKCCENLRFKGKVKNVTVKRVANIWFAIVNVEAKDTPIETPPRRESQAIVGVDMGIKSLIILSDGTIYKNPKALHSNLKNLKRLHRGLTRKVKGSNNRKRQKIRIARKYYRISNIRKNAIHQATAEIVKKYDKIIIETLKPLNFLKNKCLAKSFIDASFGEIARQLSYKSLWQGKEVVKASQWFPSSKTCSSCGNKKEVLKLSERIYKCSNCGLEIDRDVNAAKNLANYSPTSKYEGSEACGETSESSKIQRCSKKHEVNTVGK